MWNRKQGGVLYSAGLQGLESCLGPINKWSQLFKNKIQIYFLLIFWVLFFQLATKLLSPKFLLSYLDLIT